MGIVRKLFSFVLHAQPNLAAVTGETEDYKESYLLYNLLDSPSSEFRQNEELLFTQTRER